MIKRFLPDTIQQKVNRVIRRSVEFAFEHPKSSLAFIRSHAQAMSEEVIYKHIQLYVNPYSIDLGKKGRQAVSIFFEEAIRRNMIPVPSNDLFLLSELGFTEG